MRNAILFAVNESASFLTDATTCNNGGTCLSDGSCLCNAQFTGATCDSCNPGSEKPCAVPSSLTNFFLDSSIVADIGVLVAWVRIEHWLCVEFQLSRLQRALVELQSLATVRPAQLSPRWKIFVRAGHGFCSAGKSGNGTCYCNKPWIGSACQVSLRFVASRYSYAHVVGFRSFRMRRLVSSKMTAVHAQMFRA